MQTTKHISQQAQAGAEALAERAETIQYNEDYYDFKNLVRAFLSDYKDFQLGFLEIDNVSKLAGLLTDLGLDSGHIGNKANDLKDNVQKIQQGLDNIVDILEDLKEV